VQNLDELIRLLSIVKSSQKELAAEEASLKEQIIAIMKDSGFDKEDTDYGSVRIQQRNEKKYSSCLCTLEQQLKEDKKLADDMGDYTIVSSKESLVFVLPKE
jgi:hypothetical protein